MVLNELIFFLLVWISLNTEYETSKFDFPVNVLKPIVTRNCLWWEVSSCWFFFKGVWNFIVEMDLSDICNQSILLHEMIHALQNDSVEIAFKEKEAYELQNKFLEELSLKNDMIEILNVNKCRSYQSKRLF